MTPQEPFVSDPSIVAIVNERKLKAVATKKRAWYELDFLSRYRDLMMIVIGPALVLYGVAFASPWRHAVSFVIAGVGMMKLAWQMRGAK